MIVSSSTKYAVMLKKKIQKTGILSHPYNAYDVVLLEGGFTSLHKAQPQDDALPENKSLPRDWRQLLPWRRRPVQGSSV